MITLFWLDLIIFDLGPHMSLTYVHFTCVQEFTMHTMRTNSYGIKNIALRITLRCCGRATSEGVVK